MFRDSWFLLITLDLVTYNDLCNNMTMHDFFKVWEQARKLNYFDEK